MLESSSLRFVGSPRSLVLCSSKKKPRKGQANTGQRAKDRERKTLSGFSSLPALLSKASQAKPPQSRPVESGKPTSEVALEASANAPDGNLLHPAPQQGESHPIVGNAGLLEQRKTTKLENQAEDEAQEPNGVGSSQASFGETVWAALQLSAYERQKSKAQRRRKVYRAGVTTVQPLQRDEASVHEVKPLVIQPEWATKLHDLEQKIDSLKHIYYNRL